MARDRGRPPHPEAAELALQVLAGVYTRAEAAERAGVSQRTVARWVASRRRVSATERRPGELFSEADCPEDRAIRDLRPDQRRELARRLADQALGNATIAKIIGVSPRTVQVYLRGRTAAVRRPRQ